MKAIKTALRLAKKHASNGCGLITNETVEIFGDNLSIVIPMQIKGSGMVDVETLKKIADKCEIKYGVISDQKLTLNTNRGEYTIDVDHPRESMIKEEARETSFSIELDKEVKDLKQFSHKDHLTMCGICFNKGEVAATDGHKLKWIKRDEVVSNRRVQKDIFDLPNGRYEVSYSKNFTYLLNDGITYRFPVPDGKFPNYKAVIPESFAHHMTFDKKELMKSIESAMVIAPLWVELNASGAVAAGDQAIRFETSVKCDSDCNFPMLFSPKDLSELLKTAQEDVINMQIVDNVRSVIVNGNSLIMPIPCKP